MHSQRGTVARKNEGLLLLLSCAPKSFYFLQNPFPSRHDALLAFCTTSPPFREMLLVSVSPIKRATIENTRTCRVVTSSVIRHTTLLWSPHASLLTLRGLFDELDFDFKTCVCVPPAWWCRHEHHLLACAARTTSSESSRIATTRARAYENVAAKIDACCRTLHVTAGTACACASGCRASCPY
jgi:hypothetical protein